MKRKQFTFYRSFFEAMSEMNLTQRGKAVTLLCQFALDGEEPEPQKGALKMYFDLVMPNLRASRKKALAGQFGSAVTNRKRSGKKENEIEKENEKENEKESESNCGMEEKARESFERFWDLYPVKIGKEEAWAAWQRKLPDEDTVCKSVALWKKSRQWNQEKTRFVPRAAKFLEQEYYLQKPEGAGKVASCTLGDAELEAITQIMREGAI